MKEERYNDIFKDKVIQAVTNYEKYYKANKTEENHKQITMERLQHFFKLQKHSLYQSRF